ncbi:unnamed protein product [Moneuplotes crassus]|uniref:UBC core domain-containing protein n=2 Tax=Euplotes crassus TaxID=5936 RepID=A0AAD2D9V2_EUPCR|nr:unnamed protein product [Moneuplotes crassus]
MESNTTVKPGESKIMNTYGDARTLDAQVLQDIGIIVNEANVTDSSKNKDVGTTPAQIGFRFMETEELYYALSPNNLKFEDTEGGFNLQGNTEFSSGQHTWELIFPTGINSVEFGVKSSKTLRPYVKKFKTTTPRFAAVTLNVEKKTVSMRLNKDPSTDKTLYLNSEGPFVPFVTTPKPNIPVVLNPYPRIQDFQKVMGSKFEKRQYLKQKLDNALGLSHLPRGFGVNSDSAFLSKFMDLPESDIKSIYLPKDSSHFQYLKGWAVVTLTSADAYSKWEKKKVTAENKKIATHSTDDLIEYAINTSVRESAKGETLQMIDYINDICNQDSDDATEENVKEAYSKFISKMNTLIEENSIQETHLEGLSVYPVRDQSKLLVVTSDGKAKLINKDKNSPINLQDGLRTPQDHQVFTLSKEEFTTLFSNLGAKQFENLHPGLKQIYFSFFKSMEETAKIRKGDIVQFSSPAKEANIFLNEMMYDASKERVKRSRKFLNLEVIGVNDPHSRIPSLESDKEALDIYQDCGLKILTKLSEQLWCGTLSPYASKELNSMMASVSRPFSHLERLSTFIGTEQCFQKLAKYGYINREDKVFYNVFDEREISEISQKCNDLLKDTLTLKRNINIPLEESLSYLPPTLLGEDTQIIVSPVSDFIFTFSKTGSLTVYTTGLGITKVAEINFGEEEKEITGSVENKKYASSLITYEVNNARARLGVSNNNKLNLIKENRDPPSGGDPSSKSKPKKNCSITIKTSPKKVNYDEESYPTTMAALFGDNDEYYEEFDEDQEIPEVDEAAEEDSENKEETKKETECEEKVEEQSSKIISYTIHVSEKYLTSEFQGIVTVIFEDKGKLYVQSKNLIVDFAVSYLHNVDYSKYAISTMSKKKIQEDITSEIITKQRSNIVHIDPFYNQGGRNKTSPIIWTLGRKIELENIKRILCTSNSIHGLSNDFSVYALAENNDSKVVLIKIENHISGEGDFVVNIGSTTETDLSVEETYKMYYKDNKVAIVSDSTMVVYNSQKLDEKKQSILDNQTNEVIFSMLDLIEFEPQVEEEKKDVKKEEIKDEQKVIEEQQDLTAELLKEGDCDVKELNQLFSSKPTSIITHSTIEDSNVVFEEKFLKPTKNFDKIDVNLYFNTKENFADENIDTQKDVEYKSKQSNMTYSDQANLSLKIESFTGNCINPTFHPSRLLDDDYSTQSYISNYPKPTVIFSQSQDSEFLPMQFTVSSKFHRAKASSDSYPVGAGLIFCANSVEQFTNVKKYLTIQTRAQYERWQENRAKVNLPLGENEPVAFFELGSEREVTVNFDQKRLSKYILLLPTDFRKKPIKFTRKFYSHSCEIESFKVVGRVATGIKALNQDAYDLQINDKRLDTLVKADIEVNKGGNWSKLISIDKIQVTHIESNSKRYCISLLDRIKSSVTCSYSDSIDLSVVKEGIKGIRVVLDTNSHAEESFWKFMEGHLVLYSYPSEIEFKSKGMKRISQDSIQKIYYDPQLLKEHARKLLDIINNKEELEHIRTCLLSHLNSLTSPIITEVLKEHFDYKLYLEDPDLFTFSDEFKTTILKTVNKIGLSSQDSEDRSFFDYTKNIIESIQDKGVPNFDINTIRMVYLLNKECSKEAFQKNYELLSKFIFQKALPELENSDDYVSFFGNFHAPTERHITSNVLLRRSKKHYELTTAFTNSHSIDSIKLLFDEECQDLLYQLDISVFEVDEHNNEKLVYTKHYGDDVYQLCTRKREPDEQPDSIIINLKDIDTVASYYRIKIDHIPINFSKQSAERDPLNAIIPLYYGKDTGVNTVTNSEYEKSKSVVKQNSNKLEEILTFGDLDFVCYEKETAFFKERVFTKKILKTLEEPELSQKSLLEKRKEQIKLIQTKEYEKAKALTSDIKNIKTKARNKQAKFNNMTLPEVLILSSEVMNYLASDEMNKDGSDFGIEHLSEQEQYELLKNILEWFLLPKEKVSKVISLKSAQKISSIILRKLKNANSIFFDLIEKLVKRKSQNHKRIFSTVEVFIKDMKVTEILNELLRRLGIATKINESNIDSSEKLKALCKATPRMGKDKMWIIVGTLQIISKRLQKIGKDERSACLLNLVHLGTLRFNAKQREHTCYYKLLLSLIKECSKDASFDDLLIDANLPVKFWFNILTLSTDPELYSINLKFIEKVLLDSVLNKKKAHDIVHKILVWFSEFNKDNKEGFSSLKGTIFEGIYDEDPELFSSHYCQSIDLFLASFRTDSNDSDSSKLVSNIFNSIMSALNKPSKSPSYAKIWNELFKCLAIIGTNDENVDKFVSTFVSLPGDIRDNLYTHFSMDNISLDSTKQSSQRKLTVKIVYKLLRSFFKYGLQDQTSKEDLLRTYTICNDMICILATKEPNSVNQSKAKTPVQLTKEEYIDTLHMFSEYLNCYLNKGVYTHMAGADYAILARIKMGVHLAYLVYNSELKGKKYYDLYMNEFDDISTENKSAILEKLVIWLLLNNPNNKSKGDTCSNQLARITKLITENLTTNKALILALLPNVMKEVIKFDNMILSNCHKLGIETCSSLQNNSNSIISQLFGVCLQDKELFNDFLVKMKGFDFLLQRLFSKQPVQGQASEEESKEDPEEERIVTETTPEQAEQDDSLEDLFDKEEPKKIEETSQSDSKANKPESKGIEKVNLTDAGKTMKLIESSLGSENTSQDWCMYKNGQRNRVVMKQIDKQSRSDFIMKFELTDVMEVSDIEMGLIYYWGNYDQDTHYEPMNVLCEGGMTKNQIDWCVPLRLADDGGYKQSAVNIYGSNFANFKSMNYDVDKYNKNPSSVIEAKIKDKAEVYKAKYLTFRLRRPEISCLESSMFSSILTKTMSYGFTFFSAQGIYPDNYLPLKSALIDTQKENTLEILSKCCSGNVSDVFSVIAQDKAVINDFKNSIGKLLKLLNQKEYLIKPILIALCSKNSEMSDWIIDRFLDLDSNQKQINLIGEIIKKDPSTSSKRISKILSFILESAADSNVKSTEELKDLLEITSFFHNMTEGVQIQYSIESIETLIEKSHDSPDEIQELTLSFVLFLIGLRRPLNNGKEMTSQDIIEYLLNSQNDSEERKNSKLRLASTLCASSKDLSKIIIDKEELLTSFLQLETADLSQWKHKARFWYYCAQEKTIRDYLVQKNVGPTIFSKYRKYFGPAIEDNNSDKELNDIMVSLLSKVTAGYDKVETEMASTLKEDLTIACENDRIDYLNSIVVPLLHAEETIPVTLSVVDKVGDKMVYHPIYHKLEDSSAENKFLFKSECLSTSQETCLMRMFKEHVSENHDSYDKLLNKKWTLISEDTSPKKGDFKKIADKISEKSNTLHLVKCTINGESAIFGGYCASQFPSLTTLQADYNYELPHHESNFVFYYKGDMENHFVMTNNKPFGYIYTDYELGGVISISGDFVLCSWSINYSHTAGNIYNMKCIEQPGFASFYNNINVERYECWHVDLANPSLSGLNNDKYAYHHIPFYKSLSLYNLLTNNVVFHIPKHMKAKVLSCELFGRKHPLSVKTNGEVDLEHTIGEIFEKHPDSTNLNIFELCYHRPDTDADLSKEEAKEVEDILEGYSTKYTRRSTPCSGTASTSEGAAGPSSSEQQPEGRSSKAQATYPVLEKFDGASELVKACMKAVRNWTQKDLREAWHQYLKEVESFISFPGFFAKLTSDKKNSTLFFDILSGVPESETKEALKKRQKEIEKKTQYQYNYKAPEFENPWIDRQLEMVKQTYNVVQRIFCEEDNSDGLREKCLQNGTIITFIERIGILTSEFSRVKVEPDEYNSDSEEESIVTEKKKQQRDKNRKGVGYTTDVGQEWNVNSYLKKKESKNSQITDIIGILKGVIQSEELSVKYNLRQMILESALLPVLENALRSGSVLEMAKEAELFNSYLDFITTVCENKELRFILMDIGKDYEPRQLEPIHALLDKLTGLADIFLKALSTEKEKSNKSKGKSGEESEGSKALAERIRKTNEIVKKTVSDALKTDEDSIQDILKLPLNEKYKKLLSPLRFCYMDMKSAPSSPSYTHYFSYNISQDTSIENAKVVRLAQEVADLSNSLPNEHTNAIFVRVDESRVDVMKAVICGASSTPYAHGCFEFDLYFDPRYPSTPPKCQLVTTGSGAVRFNPNLYADGKVCLSLLGTWRGSSTENWDAKFSTILQVLMSIQAIIMSEEVYYNEPGYEHEAGTTEGEAKNEAYSNIVRYCNIQYAMIDQMTKPSKGFEEAIRKHFFIKRDEVMDEVKEWLELASQNKASYASLVECHNHSWCTKFKEENRYKEMLEEAITKLEEAFKGLKEPSLQHEITSSEDKEESIMTDNKKPIAADKKTGGIKATEEDNKLLQEVDVEDDQEETKAKGIDIADEAVKDRWSRYIGAMGIDAVAKQASARILISGLGGVGAEIAKNLVLAGCKELTLNDSQPATFRDLSSNFILSEKDVGTNRAVACQKKVQQLNYYVKVSVSEDDLSKEESQEAAGIKDYDVVIMTEASLDSQILVDNYCREHNTKFISADVNGVFCRIFNDFGDEFEVIDKNGEETKELMIKEITNDKEGLVTLQEGFNHSFEDGDEVLIEKVDGMKDKEGKSINGTIHKVVTVTPTSFKIGDTSGFSEYEHSGLAKQLKTKLKMSFKPLEAIGLTEAPHDQNLLMSDFEKMKHHDFSHYCYYTVDEIKKDGKYNTIKDWNNKSFQEFGDIFEDKLKSKLPEETWKECIEDKHFIRFSSTYCVVNHGTFNPLCAFVGGVASQEAVKAITSKFVPIDQLFYYDAIEVTPEFHVHSKESFEGDMEKLGFFNNPEDRYTGLRACIGNDLLEKIKEANLFMVGAGAIGCELLKNYAMLGAGAGDDGSILVTDPDIIEVSNLNRQFLFREKHLRKPKSVTAAAAAIHMNPDMSGKIIARLDKIHKGTEDTYSQDFYKSLSIVTNALDNVAARRYIDGQCVKARVPMIDSGTLGPKGHIQVVLPDQTDSYGSTNDAEDGNEIPHCTLKMFPEQTLHCVEWARDLFSQLFNQSAKSYNKIIEDEQLIDIGDSEQMKILKEALSLIEDRPTDFKACLRWARLKFNQYFVIDIKQLLHAYPLDHKTKEGKPFWSLPKRAPEVLKFSPEDELHARLIAAAACLRATVFNIEIPFKAPRELESIMKMAMQAVEFDDEVPAFNIDHSKVEQMRAEVDESKEDQEESKQEEEDIEETIDTGEDYEEILDYAIRPIREAYQSNKDHADALKTILTAPQEFEKDDDQNYHVDFIYALANCRATNYSLDHMDWLTTKLKAGRIIPALATTTAAIAGLQTLEIVKILKQCKLEDMRNNNLNLAVPSLMAFEPGPPEKVKIKEGLELNIWDTWKVHLPKKANLKALIKKLLKKYGLNAMDIIVNGLPVYIHALDSKVPSGKTEKPFHDLFNLSEGQTELEVTVTFSDPDDKEGKILNGTPPVVIIFKE